MVREHLLSAMLVAVYVSSAAGAAPSSWFNERMISEFSYGIFCRSRTPDSLSDGSDTIRGNVERYTESPQLVQRTQVIPAIEGLTFGISARQFHPLSGEVRITVNHPPLGKGRVTKESWTTVMSAEKANMSAYFLGLSDGNPEGRWTFEGRRGPMLLFRAEFDVVAPDANSKDPCEKLVS